MDVVRAALGESRLSYLGVSYGTYLGAVYLQMFGARADRFVLDSAVDPQVYGANLFRTAGPADVAALAHWASWAAARDGEYGLGSTPAAVLSTVDNVVRRPVRIGGMLVDTHVLPYIIFAHLYDDGDEAYAAFAADVRVLRDPSLPPSAELTSFLAGVLTGTGDATDRAGTPILCADRAVSRDPNTYFRDIQAHRGDEGIFGPLTRDISPCAFWPTTPIEPPTTVHNGVPVLLLGADGDPAAPYPGQLSMHRALAGSQMVTLRGAFRHGTFLVGGSPCVDAAVDRYLVDGVLPDGDTSCTRS
jgi:pimeloyl-ACP methyl ester carboxylesterase